MVGVILGMAVYAYNMIGFVPHVNELTQHMISSNCPRGAGGGGADWPPPGFFRFTFCLENFFF